MAGNAELVIVPYLRAGYAYCAVFPTNGEDQWPPCFGRRYDRAVVLEFAPADTRSDPLAFAATVHQRWPQDVIRYLSTLGLEPQVTSAGIPFAGQEILRGREGVILDYVTLGLLSAGAQADNVSQWSALRSQLQGSLLPESLELPAGCDAVLHVAGEQLAVLLASGFETVERWLAGIIARRFLDGRHSAAADKAQAISTCLLRRADAVGLRLRAVETVMRRGGSVGLVLRGRWGRGKQIPLRAGVARGEELRIEI